MLFRSPGPEAQQLATYIGWLMHRTWGGIAAGVLFVLPSLLILIGLSWVYVAFGETTLVAGLFYGIKPAVTAIVVQAAHRIGSRALKNRGLWAIAAASFVAIFAAEVPFPAIVAAAAVIHPGFDMNAVSQAVIASVAVFAGSVLHIKMASINAIPAYQSFLEQVAAKDNTPSA